jgi:hypothetical protein
MITTMACAYSIGGFMVEDLKGGVPEQFMRSRL